MQVKLYLNSYLSVQFENNYFSEELKQVFTLDTLHIARSKYQFKYRCHQNSLSRDKAS